MGDSGQHQVTRLLQRWGSGDETALNELIELVYPELRRIASRYLHNSSGTLQSTALVHEAYLKLVGRQDIHWTDRTHFYAVAARVIRGILVDHYRAQNAAKRGGGADHVTLDGSASPAAPASDPVDLLDLDIALNELEQLDPQQARIVELRYFAGLSIEETAHATGVSPATVKRDWLVAKAWIRRRLSGGPSGASSGS